MDKIAGCKILHSEAARRARYRDIPSEVPYDPAAKNNTVFILYWLTKLVDHERNQPQ